MFKYVFVLLSLLMSCTAPTGLRTARESIGMVLLLKDGVAIGRASAVAIQCSKNIGDAGYTVHYVTARHVVDAIINNPDIVAMVGHSMVFDSSKFDVINIIHLNPGTDAALLCVQSKVARTVSKLGKGPIVDQEIVSVGYPLGIGPSTSTGVVNLRIANRSDGSWICTAPTAPGGSGGGVFDKDTLELIGITVEIGGAESGNGYTHMFPDMHTFISIDFIIQWLKETINHG